MNAVAFDITNACAGLFTGIAIADAMLKAGGARRVMVVGRRVVELRHPRRTAGDHQPGGSAHPVPDRRRRGAAVILETSSDERVGFQSIDLYTLGRYSGLCIVKPSDGSSAA